MDDTLTGKLDALPATPGCYLFSDAEGAIVYIGKAKSLRSRVRSYFQERSTDARHFLPILRRVVVDVETVVAATEKEAAVLENELIKKHQPRFNVKLRDDKDFLCLRLDAAATWPRLETVRRPSEDGARYFGPHHSATSARRTLHLVNKHFQLRTCSDAELASRSRPCLQHQIKRCAAPCVIAVDPAWYAEQVRAVTLFLDGRHDELSGELNARMRDASQSMEFERAALYRDQLRAVEAVREQQCVVSVRDIDQDVIGSYREGSVVELELVQVRAGRVRDTLSFSLKKMEIPDDEVLAGFIAQYYGPEGQRAEVPDEILVPVLPDGIDGVAEWLGDRAGHKVVVAVPRRGPRARLLSLATDNAAHSFREKQRGFDDLEARLEDLRELLRLPTLPRRIECCDISHLAGGDTVGSVVALLNGQPDKKRYRSFRVKTETAGDDYAAMYEVLARRFRRGRVAAERAARREAGAREGSATGSVDGGTVPAKDDARRDENWELPDLFVVDGGRGQLGVALSAARDLGLHDLPIVGLAKERANLAGETLVDRIYLPGQKNGILLRAGTSSLFFLGRVRDEAHRFANRARRRVGKARNLRSELDGIPGLGPAARRALLTTLGSTAAIRCATDSQILAVPGIGKRHLTALRRVVARPG